MTHFFKKTLGIFLAMSGFYATSVYSDPVPATTILVQSSLSVMSPDGTNYLYFTASNPTASAITGIDVAISIPAGCTVTTIAIPGGTTYSPVAVPGGAPGNWSIPNLAANSSVQLILMFTYNGASGITITPSGTITSGGSGSSSVAISIVPNNILVEASKTVMGVGETNNIYVTATNPTGSTISNITISVSLPAGFTINSTSVPSGSTYNQTSSVWSITNLAAHSNKQLILRVTYNGSNGKIVIPSATYTNGGSGTSSIQILIGCPFLKWSATNTPVTINNGNDVSFSSAGTTSYTKNLASQGVACTFNGRLQDINGGSTAYTARFQNSTNAGTNDLIAPVLTFNNAYPQQSPSGNAPYQMVFPNPADGYLDPAFPVTNNPPNYLEGQFVLDPVTYPNGLNGLSFFIYDIDASPTNGWQDAVIVWGTDVNNNMVAPITQYSAITTIYDIPVPSPSTYTINIGGNNPSLTYPNNLVNYSEDNPRGRVTYLFPTPITSITIRYFRNSQINSQHYVWLSNLYRGCGTDLKLNLEIENPEQCEQCFTYTVVAQNNGPSDVGLAQVVGVLPEGLTFNNATATKGTFDSSTGVWTIGSLTATPEETESLYVNVCATDSTISFSMVLYGDGDQTVPGDNVVTENVTVTYIVVQDAFAITGATTPVNINWAANDYSIGGTLNLNSFNFTPPSPTEGVVTVPSPGSGFCTFTPNPSFSGTALIPYSVSDSNDCIGTATIHVMINGAPIARDDSATTIPDRLVTIDVAANDTYAVDSVFTLSTPPSHGVADVNTTGTAVTYTPNPGFCGVDTFTYTITQPDEQTATATVTVTVVCPPIAVPDFASTAENTPVNINVAANDTYLPGSVFSLLTNASNGTAVVNPNGTSTYTPNNGFCGVDTYTYMITQQPDTDYTQTASTTVTVDVVCGIPPQAYNDSATTKVNTPVTIPVLLNDIAGSYPLNPASVTIVTQPQHGTITGIDLATGNVTYMPNPYYIGPDTFTYQVCDTSPAPQCNTAIAYITVLPLNIPCPTVCSTDCCPNPCLDEVNECMCNANSFAHFSPVSGTWTQIGSVVNTIAPLSTSNFLEYNTAVAQAHEELQIQIQFPVGQLLTQFVSAGVVTDWNGSNQTNQRVAYITFDNRTGTPVSSKLAIGGLNSTEVVFNLPFQIVLGQTYTMRLEKNFLQTNVYIDNTFIGSSTTGTVTGNYLGMFASQSTVNFSNLTSCSYALTAPNFVANPI